MLYVDIPTSREIQALNMARTDACISIYLKTTPHTQRIAESRIALGNLVRQALDELIVVSLDKRKLGKLQEHFDALLDDDEFWEHQAHSLAILSSPEMIRTYRLANQLNDTLEVSDRFHLKPLLRATTFPHAAHVLAVSENAVRLIEVSSDLPATEISVPEMPADAASTVGKASNNDSEVVDQLAGGTDGTNVHLAQYIRKIDTALRPVLLHSDVPVVLAATAPVDSLFRSVSAVELLPRSIQGNPDRMTPAELASAARPVLDQHYQSQIDDFHHLFEHCASEKRAITDISEAARAATFGAIDTLLVDIDAVVNGQVDDETGAVSLAQAPGASSYGVVDEIAGRALRSGARVLAVRQSDIPDGKALAAILRFTL